MHLPYRQRYFIRNQYFVTKHTNAFSELLREPGENSQICRKLAGKAKNRYFAFLNSKNHSSKLLGSSFRQSKIAITMSDKVDKTLEDKVAITIAGECILLRKRLSFEYF